MRRVLRAIEALAWAAFFAFALVVLAVRFWILPGVERYREDIVAAVSATVGQPVEIGRIEAGWLGINPQVNLYDVRILDGKRREVLRLPAIENSIAWRSLLYGELRLHALAIDGPRLTVLRDKAGDVFVAGLRLPRPGETPPASGQGGLADWVLGQPEIIVRNAEVEWRDEKRAAPPLVLSGLGLRLRNSLWEHSAGLQARVPPQLGTAIELRAELTGRSLAEPGAWRGRVYLETGYTDLAGWKPWIDYPVEVTQGHGALRVWAGIENGALAELTADVSVADFVPGMRPLEARLGWKAAGRDPERGSFAARVADLESLAKIAQVLPLAEETRRLVAGLAPRGELKDVRVDWQRAAGEAPKLTGRARFADAAIEAFDGRPGFSGLSGAFDGGETRGALTVDGRPATLTLPGVFPDPRLVFDSLAGQATWEHDAGRGWTVKLASLAFANADLEGRASGAYSHPGFGRGAIDLTAEVKRADGTKVERYLPSPSIMGAQTREWLAGAIRAGHGHDARLRLRGELADFPFTDPAKGEFQVTARVERGVLVPGAGWPELRDIDAQLLFERDRMEIIGRSATLMGAKLANVRAGIAALSARTPQLVVTGQAEGTLGQFLRFVDASPVEGMTGGITSGMVGAGRGRLGLRVEIPLGEVERTRVAGEFDFTASSLIAHPDLPPIERAAGALHFTESTLTVREGRGRLLGGTLSVSGGSKAGGGLEIVARGDASVTALQPMMEPSLRRYFSGAAPYTATLSLREGRGRVSIESSLRGVSSVLPAPLAKGAAEALPLRIDVIPADAGRERVSMQLGTLAHVELLRRRQGDASEVQRASVWLSPRRGETPRIPERPGVLVYGSLASLDADRWLQLLYETDTEIGVRHRIPESGKTNPVSDTEFPVRVDVRVGTLDAFGKRLRELALQATQEGGAWKAKLKAVELAGDVSYRGEEGGQVVARLEHLTVPGDTPGTPARDAPAREREFPAVDLVAERFTLGKRTLGRLEFAAVRDGVNWRIDRLGLANPDGALTGKGLWRTGPASYTALSLELESPDSGKLLARLGYPNVVRGAPTRMQASLSWNGEPVALHYPSLSGEIQIQSEEGQFLEIDPGVGKLLSIMSLQQLPRRLTLDFRDVFSKGFQFDRLRSAATLEKGLMTLKDFEMRGSAADVAMSGQVDLAKETQALRVKVVPQLGDTASTALLFVNPFLFFPAAIAQRILKDPLGHIFAFNYSVTGSWDDPKIERTRVEAQPVPQESGVRE